MSDMESERSNSAKFFQPGLTMKTNVWLLQLWATVFLLQEIAGDDTQDFDTVDCISDGSVSKIRLLDRSELRLRVKVEQNAPCQFQLQWNLSGLVYLELQTMGANLSIVTSVIHMRGDEHLPAAHPHSGNRFVLGFFQIERLDALVIKVGRNSSTNSVQVKQLVQFEIAKFNNCSYRAMNYSNGIMQMVACPAGIMDKELNACLAGNATGLVVNSESLQEALRKEALTLTTSQNRETAEFLFIARVCSTTSALLLCEWTPMIFSETDIQRNGTSVADGSPIQGMRPVASSQSARFRYISADAANQLPALLVVSPLFIDVPPCRATGKDGDNVVCTTGLSELLKKPDTPAPALSAQHLIIITFGALVPAAVLIGVCTWKKWRLCRESSKTADDQSCANTTELEQMLTWR